MNRTALSRRLMKLEADQSSRRLACIFGTSDAQIEAEKAEKIRTGQASERDTFLVFRTIYEERPCPSHPAALQS